MSSGISKNVFNVTQSFTEKTQSHHKLLEIPQKIRADFF